MTGTQAGSESEPSFNLEINMHTEDFPRESLGRVIVNYVPSVLIFLGFIILPAALVCRWTGQLFDFVGNWGYLPIFVAFGPTTLGFLLLHCRARVLHSASWKTVARRTGWLLLHNVMLLALFITVPWIPIHIIHIKVTGWPILLFDLIFLSLECYCLLCSWTWYRRCWYEKVIVSQNEELYGHTVFVSSPVLKLCGHYVIIIRDHKYELRLEASTGNRPVFKDRLLQPGESEELRNAPGAHWSIVGWTRHEDAEVQAGFNEVIEKFGVYHRLRNNCRHFLHDGCSDILAVHAEDDMVMTAGTLDLSALVLLWLTWKSTSRELYRWGWTQWYGPEWESHAVSEVADSVLLEDLKASTPDPPDWLAAVIPGVLWEDRPRPDDRWVPTFYRMLLPICFVMLLVGWLIWRHTTTEVPRWDKIPIVLTAGLSGMAIVGLIFALWLWVMMLQRPRSPNVAL
ncbi:hypothetical protein BV22DRAFT_1198312 [Leucogyrophana mollusca]|uniref:Uncharacterized protein n=1 Tax=Leucogyrophana mollusca TaxID=85980 RepID=A0ACB8B6I5_9AGAM|nr:hypothetical protein BV22DRAFT_1198312 [Leucogyrophana mollusca]